MGTSLIVCGTLLTSGLCSFDTVYILWLMRFPGEQLVTVVFLLSLLKQINQQKTDLGFREKGKRRTVWS